MFPGPVEVRWCLERWERDRGYEVRIRWWLARADDQHLAGGWSMASLKVGRMMQQIEWNGYLGAGAW